MEQVLAQLTGAPWQRVRDGVSARLGRYPGLQAVASNAGWLVIDRVMRLALGLVVGVWIARYLGPAQFGALSYAVAFAGAFAVLATLGLDAIVVRELARRPQRSNVVLGTTFALKLLGGASVVLLAVIAFATGSLGAPGGGVGLVALVAGAYVFQAFDVADFWFQARVRSKYTAIARATAFVVMAGVRVVLVWTAAPLVAFACAILLEAMLAALALSIAFVRDDGAPRSWRVHASVARDLLRQSWPLMLSAFAIWVYMRIDQLMIGALLGETAVGTYAVAVRLAEVWFFVPAAIVSSVFPALLRARDADAARYRARTQALFTLLAILGYVVAIALTLGARPLVVTLYGIAYADAARSLAVLAWAGIFVALGIAREAWIVAEGLTRFSFATTLCGAALNVVGNWVLIPRYGTLGAATATVAAQAVSVVVATLLYQPMRVIFSMQLRALTLRGLARS